MYKIVKNTLIVNSWYLLKEGVIVGSVFLEDDEFVFHMAQKVWDRRELSSISNALDALEYNMEQGLLDTVGIYDE